jgi:hypothetical protein
MRLPENVNYNLEYAKPINFNVVGSYPLKISAKSGDALILDLMVMMPPVSYSIFIKPHEVIANETRVCLREKITLITDTSISEPSIWRA